MDFVANSKRWRPPSRGVSTSSTVTSVTFTAVLFCHRLEALFPPFQLTTLIILEVRKTFGGIHLAHSPFDTAASCL